MSSLRIATILAAAVMTGCALFGGKVSLSTSPTMPAAEGGARFSVSKNDNTVIVLSVKHLAHPDKLTPPASSYVVWTKANKDAMAQSIGALKVDSDLSGSLLAETPLHSFELIVTAEPSGEIQQPTGQPLLWTSYSR
ncbi:MAG: anti-sigma factor [Elusimicrobia bacterium]|nr:anti-sigma factor [Elusimicrobiota bacterium]